MSEQNDVAVEITEEEVSAPESVDVPGVDLEKLITLLGAEKVMALITSAEQAEEKRIAAMAAAVEEVREGMEMLALVLDEENAERTEAAESLFGSLSKMLGKRSGGGGRVAGGNPDSAYYSKHQTLEAAGLSVVEKDSGRFEQELGDALDEGRLQLAAVHNAKGAHTAQAEVNGNAIGGAAALKLVGEGWGTAQSAPRVLYLVATKLGKLDKIE